MHQRRKNPISPAVASDRGDDSHPQLQNGRTSHHTRRPTSSSSFTLILLLLFSVFLFLEFIAYRVLNDTNSSVDQTDHVHQSTPAASPPTKRPTTSTLSRSSFEPTNKDKGWRVKAARRASHENSYFWRTHEPDEVPPLPPSTDPSTGEELPPVVAYVTTLTKCAPKHKGPLDGAAVLMHSIRRNSYGWTPMQQNGDEKWPKYGGQGGRYRYRAYVIVDPEASPLNPSRSGECARALQKLGYIVLHRAPLVPLFEITDEFHPDMTKTEGASEFFIEYRNKGYVGQQRPIEGPLSRPPTENPDKLKLMMNNDGCCGYTETLKLHVYGLIEHELAVHLDFDSLILRPMDDLFDAMLGKSDGHNNIPIAKGPKTKTPDFTKPIDAAFTRDYNSVNKPSLDAPVGYQGGFLVVRPSLEVLERYRTVLKEGAFLLNPRKGWGGKHGGYYGDLTFQGLLPYYYEEVSPSEEHNAIELDRCIYNQMADNPRKSTYKFPRATPLDPDKMGFKDTDVCRDGRKDCSDTDCQRVLPSESLTTHFTFCKKPWDCSDGLPGTVADETCKGLLSEWFAVRKELEDWWLSGHAEGQPSYSLDATIVKVHQQREGELEKDRYLGYCNEVGSGGYRRMVEPDTSA
eukprot:scaffold4900_cov193-Alexandrium_tamarense.AAC.4